jgi:hypothetical protein
MNSPSQIQAQCGLCTRWCSVQEIVVNLGAQKQYLWSLPHIPHDRVVCKRRRANVATALVDQVFRPEPFVAKLHLCGFGYPIIVLLLWAKPLPDVLHQHSLFRNLRPCLSLSIPIQPLLAPTLLDLLSGFFEHKYHVLSQLLTHLDPMPNADPSSVNMRCTSLEVLVVFSLVVVLGSEVEAHPA